MPTSPYQTFTHDVLIPVMDAEDALEIPVNLAANLTLPKGQALYEGPSGVYGPYAGASVQAAPVGAPVPTAAAGTTPFLAGTYNIAYTYVNANGETTLSPTATVTLTAGQQINVAAVTPLPTGVTAVNYYVSTVPGGTLLVRGTTALNTGAATAITGFATPAAIAPTTNTAWSLTGGGAPRLLLKYACATDASGNVTMGLSPTGGLWGETRLDAPAFFAGTFRIQDLVNLDAFALAQMGGRVVAGALGGNGIVRFG